MRSNKSLTNLETRLSPGNIRRGNQNKPWRPHFRFSRQHTRKLLIQCPRLSAKLFSAEWMRWERASIISRTSGPRPSGMQIKSGRLSSPLRIRSGPRSNSSPLRGPSTRHLQVRANFPRIQFCPVRCALHAPFSVVCWAFSVRRFLSHAGSN